jgi:hypothetical protein
VRHLYAGLRSEYERAFAGIPPGTERLGAAIDLLWEMWLDPRLTAVIELHVAARTDDELARALEKVTIEHQQHIEILARRFFPSEALAGQHFFDLLDVVQEALRGMAVGRLVGAEEERTARSLAALKRLVAAAIHLTPSRDARASAATSKSPKSEERWTS